MTSPLSRLARIALFALFPALLLAACADEEGDQPDTAESDALEDAALGDQIMVDPDLAGENLANSAVLADLRNGILPPERRSPAAVSKARADALAQLGGPSSLMKAPAASANSNSGAGVALTAAGKAAASPGGSGDCAAIATYTADWAARLPAGLPVYPMGAVVDAAGTDANGCSLRVVTFLSAMPLGEVLDYYYTLVDRAGYSASHALDGEYDVLGGTKGRSSYIVYGRTLPTAATEITLVTSGS